MSAHEHLRDLLTSARPTWTCKDVDAVESKLKRIGVQSIPELLIELKANSLNESLRSKGEKRFCQSTLLALKKCCSTWCGSRERKRRKEPQNKVAQVSEMPSGSDLGPKGLSPGLSTLECPAARPLEELSDTELWTEYMSEGIAPPSFSRDNLIRMLEVVRSWRTASPMELSQLCWSFGLAASAEESQDVLCQRLKNQTWEAWQIPIQRFLGNGNMAEAYELLEHFQELELMSADELLVLCHKKGLPIEQSLDAVVMKERLKLVAFWEQLPLAELEMELCRTLKEFSSELIKGETRLLQVSSGEILVITEVVMLILHNPETKETLVQTAQMWPDGKTSHQARIPGAKRRPDENQFLCARRILKRQLEIDENAVRISQDVGYIEEDRSSRGYPGLKTVYRKRVIKGEVIPNT